ncbi:MAG: hypothetical protein IMF05_15830, partial [Proteobacteria bacterium]|nr:hypothetical protein [Pseudomonadota bacterium]
MTDDHATPPAETPPPPRSTVGYPGRFADGKSAVIREVRAQFGGDGVRIMDMAGLELESWLYDDIRLVDRPV